MKGKLQKSWVLSSLVLMGLTTTLPSVNMVLAETVNETQNTEKQDVTMPYDNLLEEPTTESSDTQQESTVEEQPTFSLEKEQMVGTLGETTEVVILVDRPMNQVQVTIPQEITIQREGLSEGLEATQMTETEWWFSADERTEFTIPVSSETAGEFTIRVEDELDGTIAFEEAADEGNDESVVTDDEDNTSDSEDSVTQEVQDEEETPTQETQEVTPATTSNVSTWAQFLTAYNNNSVTEINMQANITRNNTTAAVRSNGIIINGNGYYLNSGTASNHRQFFFNTSTTLRTITIKNITLINQNTNTNRAHFFAPASNLTTSNGSGHWNINFENIDYQGVGSANGLVYFDSINTSLGGGIVTFKGNNNLVSSSSTHTTIRGANIQIEDGSKVMAEGNIFSIGNPGTIRREATELSISSESSLEYKGNLRSSGRINITDSKLYVDGQLGFNELSMSGDTTQVSITNGAQARGTNPKLILQENAGLTINSIGIPAILGDYTGTFDVVINNNSTFYVKSMNYSGATIESEEPITITIYNANYDIKNLNSERLIQGNSVEIDLSSKNLAVWNVGNLDIENSLPSQNFEHIKARLSGINANTIIETNHNVFRSTFSGQGLAGYSRISSSGIASENPVDPLEPDTEINPDNPPVIPENQGNFRLDFVSQFTFGSQERNMFEEETYYALSQYGLDSNGEVIENEPKPNFVQITDNRADADGWQLSVTQREQFKTETGNELSGASLQLKNRQLVADHDGQQPRESTTEETIILEPGAKQPLLTSSTGEGKGTWIYRFGDGTSSDQSVALVVPKETIPEATTYQTKLDWELQVVPGNE